MIGHELEYATRLAVSCALSPPTTPDAIDVWAVQAYRATNTLWLLQQRVIGLYEEEKTESWRVPRIPDNKWGQRFTLAVDALADADITHLEPLPTAASKYLSTWNRVLMRLSKHFGRLRGEFPSGSPLRRHTNSYLQSPNTGLDSTAHHRGTEGHRHQSEVGRRVEPGGTV